MQPPDPRPFRRIAAPGEIVAIMLVMASLAVYYRLSWPTVNAFLRSIDFCEKPFCDFVDFYYEMGKQVFASRIPSMGFYYSPFFAVVLGVFGMLPLAQSMYVWGCLIVLGTGGIWWLSFSIVASDSYRPSIALFLGMFLSSFPILHNFKWGQVSVFLVLGILGVLVSARGRSWALPSLFLALAISMKYYPVVFVLPFLFRRDWKVIAGLCGWCIILFFVVPSIVLGVEDSTAFWLNVIRGGFYKQMAAGGPNSNYFPNVAARLIEASGAGTLVSKTPVRALGFFIAEVIVAMAFVASRTFERRKALEWSFVLLFLSVPFFVATSWPHYFVFLPFCQLFLYREAAQTTNAKLVRGLVIASIATSSVFLSQLAGGWEIYNRLGFLLFGDVLLILGSALTLWQLKRRSTTFGILA